MRNSSGAGWTLREKASLCADVGVGLANTATDSSAKSLNFTNTIQEEQANAYQSVKINKSGAQSYVISGWAMADAVPDTLTVRYDSVGQGTVWSVELQGVMELAMEIRKELMLRLGNGLKKDSSAVGISPRMVRRKITGSYRSGSSDTIFRFFG